MAVALALAVFAEITPAAVAQQAKVDQATSAQAPSSARSGGRQRLIMKDGSDQLVREWEVRGDRVRYYSLERDAWEEVPYALVDWKATGEAGQRHATEAVEKAEQVTREARAIEDEALGPEIAPGLRLPTDADGVFVIVEGKAQAVPKQQASARVDKGRLVTNVLLPVPLLKNRNLVEIPGTAAELRLAQPPAVLFASGRARDDSRYALVRLKPKGDKRQVEAILTNILGRNPKHSGDYIELDTQSLGHNVYKLVPREPLTAGEYAVVEFLGNDLNMFLWDFAVDANRKC